MDTLSSSPDPLNDFPEYHQSPSKPRRTSAARRSLALGGSSPRKQTFELDVGHQLSPQKIRVTVEAGNSDIEITRGESIHPRRASPAPSRRPVNRRGERTTTTTIPLKGLSDSEEEPTVAPKRGRGRPRKSADPPTTAKKPGRVSTPNQKKKGRTKSISSLVSEDGEDIVDVLLGRGVEVGRGKGRSRSKSTTKGTSRKSTPAGKNVDSSNMTSSKSTTTTRRRGRKSTLSSEDGEVSEKEIRGGADETGVSHLGSMAEALSPVNREISPSAYSTLRSTTSVGFDEPDITIARFDPGEVTPRNTGWSSPRVVRSPRDSSATRQRQSYPSPSASPEKPKGPRDEGDNIAMIPGDADYQAEMDNELEEDSHYHHEEEANDDYLHEFDTILESEGFSMISVDSVPSMREHMSSPSNPRKAAKPLRNNIVTNLQITEAVGNDDSFSSIPEDVLEAATPGHKAFNRQLLSVDNSRMNDSFSSIAPEILQAATPARKTQASKLAALTTSRLDDSFSSIAPAVLEAATPGRDLPKAVSRTNQSHNENPYEDKSSAVPPSTLNTPGSVYTSQNLNTAKEDSGILQGRDTVQPTISTRLPTPEETPSPLGEGTSRQSPEAGKAAAIASPINHSTENIPAHESSIFSQMKSSPPSVAPRRYTYTAHLRQKRDLLPNTTQTPSIIFSSPSLPPPIQFSKGHPVFAPQGEQNPRPKLSPTVRAGRVLQTILEPNSPRARAQSLGSPFKSPVMDKKPSSSANKEMDPFSDGRYLKPLPRVDLTSNLVGGSQRDRWNNSIHQEDPFGNDDIGSRHAQRPADKQDYTLGLPEKRRTSDPYLSNIRSEDDSIRSDDAMSWQAEEEVHIASTVPPKTSTRGEASYSNARESTNIPEQRWVAERDAVKKQAESASVIVIDSETESHDFEDDADFDLLLETLNSSSPPIEQRREQPKVSNAEKPRRSKIPSPWRKNSKRLVYNDELSHLSSPPKPYIGLKQKALRDDDEMDLSDFPIPQKANFNPRVREKNNVSIADLLLSSPHKIPLPVLPRSSRNIEFIRQEPILLETSTVRRVIQTGSSELTPASFDSIPQKKAFNPRVREKDADRSILSASPDKRSKSFLSSIFGHHPNRDDSVGQSTPEIASSSSESKTLDSTSPSRTNSLTNSLPKLTGKLAAMQTSSSVASPENYSSPLSNEDQENRSIDNRTQKWTETVPSNFDASPNSTSPTKSCLRTPLKTPGNESDRRNNGSAMKKCSFCLLFANAFFTDRRTPVCN